MAPSPATSDISFTMTAGDGAKFAPNMPVTIVPSNVAPTATNSEIGYITEVVDDVLTITRAQEGTTAKQVQAGWVVMGTITAKTVTDLETAIDSKYPASNPSGYVSASGAASAAPVQSVAGRTGAVTLAKADVGLSNVDNTSDASKPVSSATQTALDGKANTSHSHAIADTTGLQTALDGKVEDSVTDGHTTVAPSGNAVFDALALKADLISPTFTTPDIGTATGSASLNLLVTGGTLTGALTARTITPVTTATYKLGDSTHYYTYLYSAVLQMSSVAYVSSTGGKFINTSTSQYSSAGFFMYSNTASMGDYAGVHMATNIMDAGATTANFAIDRVDYTGAYKASLLSFDLNNSGVKFGVNVMPSVNGSLALGTSSLYWSNLYATRHYLNATSYIDGATAGQLKVTGLLMPVQAPTASAPAYVQGGIYFDTTLNKLRVGGATAWETITST